MRGMDVIRLLACISLILGAVECFAGFKIMKVTLAMQGFLIGALTGVILGVASGNSALGVAMVFVFGIGIALLSYMFYQVGVFALTAFLAMTAAYIISRNIPISLIVAAMVGCISLLFIKPMVILTTAFAGTGIILASAYIITGLGINVSNVLTAVLWIPVAGLGVACQYVTTSNVPQMNRAGERAFEAVNRPLSYSERRYPGMQRAYRNFCIKCGSEMQGTDATCPRCGFCFDR